MLSKERRKGQWTGAFASKLTVRHRAEEKTELDDDD